MIKAIGIRGFAMVEGFAGFGEVGGGDALKSLRWRGSFGGADTRRHDIFGLISFSAKTEDARKVIAGKEGAQRE